VSRLPLPRSRAARAGLAVAGLLVAINVVGAVIDALAPSPSGPSSSSFATRSEGLAAWAELARRDGLRVRALRDAPSRASLSGGGTVAVMDAGELTGDEARALRAFAERGGRVVVGGRLGGWSRTLLAAGERPDWEGDGPRTATSSTSCRRSTGSACSASSPHRATSGSVTSPPAR
jgi:hypothetical protein